MLQIEIRTNSDVDKIIFFIFSGINNLKD